MLCECGISWALAHLFGYNIFVTGIDIDHFYSLAEEAGFFGDTGRMIGVFTKLSNGDRG